MERNGSLVTHLHSLRRDIYRSSLSDIHVTKDIPECDHVIIFEEDIGYLCRLCGLIQRSIKSIIEFHTPLPRYQTFCCYMGREVWLRFYESICVLVIDCQT